MTGALFWATVFACTWYALAEWVEPHTQGLATMLVTSMGCVLGATSVFIIVSGVVLLRRGGRDAP